MDKNFDKIVNYEIYANGKKLIVHEDMLRSYDIKTLEDKIYKTVWDRPSFAIFSVDKTVNFEVKCNKFFEILKIRPLSANIKHHVINNSIYFTMEKPQKISLEFDNNLSEPLLLFVTSIDKNIPDATDEKVHFFHGGKSYDIGLLELKSNETLYIEEGAVVYGAILIKDAENVKIRGRGILNGTKFHRFAKFEGQQLISANTCKNLYIEGVTLFDGPQWHLVPVNCEQVIIKNINIISFVPSGDGIDIVGCRNVEIEGCFFKTNDDCISIKSSPLSSYIYLSQGENGNSPVYNILIHHCICWSATHGNALEIGYELCTDEVANIVFKNCDIIHCEYEGYQSGGVFTIHNGDSACVHDVLYENIRIEDAKEKLIDIKVLKAVYSNDDIRGQIRNIYFKNIQVIDGKFPSSIIRGFESSSSIFKVVHGEGNSMYVVRDLNGEGSIKDIVIDGLYAFGKKVDNFYDAKLVVEIATNVKFV